MKIFTTINPNGNFESQNEAISSWSNRYNVYSVNTRKEIESIKDIYPNVIFIETNDTFNYNGKKLIKLNSILSSIEEISENETVAIVNSDIILNENIELNINKRYLINGVFIGTRYELDGNKKYPFIHGYDIFIFNSKYSNIFKNDKYVIGMPWWDYWVPIVTMKKGLNLYHIKDEVIYHRTHDTNYDMEIWKKFGEKLYDDLIIDKSNITIEHFLRGDENEQMDFKKFIESKQINISLKSKKSLSQDNKKNFTICSYYFNFKNDIRQKDNLIKFLEQFNGYYDNIIIGIIDYDDIYFELPCKSVRIKGDCNNKIWSKEILINKVIDEIDTDYIMWIDADLIYQKLDWLQNIDSIVGDNDFVQLYETINYLNEKGELTETHKSIIFGCENNKPNIDKLLIKNYKPGGSWLGKTSILKENKLFEKMYVGGGDTIFVYGLFGVNNGFTIGQIGEGSKKIQNEAIEWINNFGNYKVGYLKESVNHLYHGDIKDRNYNNRYKNLKELSIIIENNSILKKGIINRTFDNVYCLNLKRRPDRWEKISEKLNEIGIKVERFEAKDGDEIDINILNKYSINKYAVGCLISHYEIIKDAKIKKYKNILILEDDVLFSNDFLEEFELNIKKIENWKMLYLGASQYDWNFDIVGDFYNSKNTLGTFAYAINEELYDEILNTNNIVDTPIDNILSKIQEKYYGQCYTFYPNIIVADVTESDIRVSREMISHSEKMRWIVEKFEKKKPFFSIIIPSYNSKYLIETLNSIQSQTIDDYECIVVDDGSNDDISQISKIYRNTKVYKRPGYLNKNANSCRNYGVYMSKGEYLIFLDSDDCLAENCLENRKNEVIKNKSYDLHIFKMGRFSESIGDNNQLVNKASIKGYLLDEFLSYNILWSITSSTWKREILYKLGGFDENLNRFQDFDIHIRFLLSSSNCIIHEETNIDCYYRDSEFHINLTEHRKNIIIDSAEYLITNYKKYGINFNKEFYQYLKKRYNYESYL